MIHAISPQSRTWLGWPSMQKASQMLALRIWAAETTGHRVVPQTKEAT